jgi:TolA-binding protein
VVSFASKLRQVVAANFVEISRPDTSDSKGTQKPKEPAPETPPSTDAVAPENLFPADEMAADSPALAGTEPTAASAVGDDVLVSASGISGEATTSTAVSVEAPVETAHSADSESVRVDPMSLVNADGSIEFSKVFARAEVPASASFTAEQALSMLHSMPSDLPLRVKRLTVKATLDAVGQAVGATPGDIVNDAGRKVTTLESFIREVSERAQELRNAEDEEIEQLRLRIAEREAEKEAISQREGLVFSSCRAKIEDLDQVVAFFTIAETEGAISADADEQADEDTDELPAYLQEDAVKRLLGLHGDSGEEYPESNSPESGAIGGRSPRSSSRR